MSKQKQHHQQQVLFPPSGPIYIIRDITVVCTVYKKRKGDLASWNNKQ